MGTRAPKGFCGRCGGTREPYKDCLPCRRERERLRYATDVDYRAEKIRRAMETYVADPAKVRARQAEYESRPEQRAAERARGLRRYQEWRTRWEERLGGLCVQCGATDDLHFDHIDWREKSFNVSVKWNHRGIDEEMLKCQLLCAPCHYRKSVGDRRSMRRLGVGRYGTSSASSSSPGSGSSSTT